jgi:malonyl-CoA/methylmalonyl-CoA synthetase
VDGRDPTHRLDGAAIAGRTGQFVTVLEDRGVEPGSRVVWSSSTTLLSVQALIAILRSGAVLVPVSPGATAAEIRHVVEDASPSLIVSDGSTRALEDPVVSRLDVPVLSLSDLEAHAQGVVPAGPSPLRPEDDALIVYTSGTTGRPKGAVHTHASLVAGVDAIVGSWDWGPPDRLILCLPLFHVHGLCAGLFGTLTAGASALLFSRFEEDAVADAASSGATMLFGVPTMYHRLAATGRVDDLRQLRVCVSGSAPLAADLWRHYDEHRVAVLERYGMTETLLTLSNPLVGERRPGSVGVPMPGVDAEIELDGDADADAGELLVRGPSLCRGYWGRTEPMREADGSFATGDVASVADDGYVTIRGRRTDMIITGGHNVYPAEVEAVLARHPGVSEVAVAGLPSDEWGETVVAFVVGDPDLASLHELAAAELASFKRPREVRLVDALPRNAMGKVVRKELR